MEYSRDGVNFKKGTVTSSGLVKGERNWRAKNYPHIRSSSTNSEQSIVIINFLHEIKSTYFEIF